MDRLFIPQNEEEKGLCEIITSSPELKKRVKALSKLRKLYNLEGLQALTALRAIEYYHHIPGGPSYFRRFHRACIFYNDEVIKLSLQ